VLKQLTIDIATHNVQAARMLANRTVNAEKVERSDEFRDLRVYNELEGKPASDIPTSNQYLNLAAKGFKRTTDLREAAAEAPALMRRAVTDAKGNPMEVESKLRSLKQNSYQTMPAPEQNPMEFARYYNWLVATQGKEAADRITSSYMTHKQINRVKSAMIP